MTYKPYGHWILPDGTFHEMHDQGEHIEFLFTYMKDNNVFYEDPTLENVLMSFMATSRDLKDFSFDNVPLNHEYIVGVLHGHTEEFMDWAFRNRWIRTAFPTRTFFIHGQAGEILKHLDFFCEEYDNMSIDVTDNDGKLIAGMSFENPRKGQLRRELKRYTE